MANKLLVTIALLAAWMPSVGAASEHTESQTAGIDVFSYSLADIMRAPENFLGKDVFFYCRFAGFAKVYNPAQTRIGPAEYVNFAAWSNHEELWTDAGRGNSLPTLYAIRNDSGQAQVLRSLKKYDLVAVSGRVVSRFSGVPWIVAVKLEPVARADAALTDAMVDHMRAGRDAAEDGDAAVAVRHFDVALALGLPAEYRAAAYECAAKANLQAGDLAGARDRLAQAMAAGRDDAALHLAAADLSLKLADPEAALADIASAMGDPDHRIAAIGMAAEANAMQGAYGEAFSRLNAVLMSPGLDARDEATLDLHRTRIYKLSGRTDDAARLYAKLAGPDSVLAGEEWLHSERGAFHENRYLNGGDPAHLDLAFAAYEKALTPGSANLETRCKMAEIEIRRQMIAGQPSFESAKRMVADMLSLFPDHLPARILEARLAAASGEVAEADALYASFATAAASDPIALAALAEAYADRGDLGRANELADKAAALQPWNDHPRAIARSLAIARPTRDGSASAATAAALLDAASTGVNEPVALGSSTLRGESSNAMCIPSDAADLVVLADAGTMERWMEQGNGASAPLFKRPSASRAEASAAFPSDSPVLPVSLPEPLSERFEPAVWMPPPPESSSTDAALPAEIVARNVASALEPLPVIAGEFMTSAPPARSDGAQTLPHPVGSVRLDDVPIPHETIRAPIADQRIGSGNQSPLPLSGLDAPADQHRGALAAYRPRAANADDGKRPVATPAFFSFASDHSPVIVAGYGSEAENAGVKPVRNPNLYRKIKNGSRRPAEIISGGTVTPGLSPMAAAEGDRLHRAEVLLPSSPPGIGIDHELAPLR